MYSAFRMIRRVERENGWVGASLPLQPKEEMLSDQRLEGTREPSWNATPARGEGREGEEHELEGGEY